MASRTDLIADLLMGAAYAGPQLAPTAPRGQPAKPAQATQNPLDVVSMALQQVMGAAYLLNDMTARLEAFDARKFDVAATVKKLGLGTVLEKRQLMELIAAVNVADGVISDEDDAYMRSVGDALGLAPEAYEDLTHGIEEVRASLYDARDSLTEARNSLLGPPPLPPPLPTSGSGS